MLLPLAAVCAAPKFTKVVVGVLVLISKIRTAFDTVVGEKLTVMVSVPATSVRAGRPVKIATAAPVFAVEDGLRTVATRLV